jgi:hypothetical protein
VKLA